MDAVSPNWHPWIKELDWFVSAFSVKQSDPRPEPRCRRWFVGTACNGSRRIRAAAELRCASSVVCPPTVISTCKQCASGGAARWQFFAGEANVDYSAGSGDIAVVKSCDSEWE